MIHSSRVEEAWPRVARTKTRAMKDVPVIVDAARRDAARYDDDTGE
jgi:hypothetical protein